MKKLLSLLLIFVFLNTHVFALSGGPKYGGGNNNVDLIGTYAGVLIPLDNSTTALTALDGESINSLGVFTLGVPEAGPATGSFLAFSNGIIFSGTFTAVGDPGKGTLKGLIDASYGYNLIQSVPGSSVTDPVTGIITVTPPSTTTIPVTASVSGVLEATVDALDFNPANIQSLIFALQRIEGTADMAVTLGQITSTGQPVIDRIINFSVDGVKQSSQVVSAPLEAPSIVIF